MKLGQDCFIVRDENGRALAYAYFEEEPGRRAAHLPKAPKLRLSPPGFPVKRAASPSRQS
jgi:hypothetical protein